MAANKSGLWSGSTGRFGVKRLPGSSICFMGWGKERSWWRLQSSAGPGLTWLHLRRSSGQGSPEAPGLSSLGHSVLFNQCFQNEQLQHLCPQLCSLLLFGTKPLLAFSRFLFWKLNLGKKTLAYSELNPSSLLQINSSNSVVIHWKAFNTKAAQISAPSVSLWGH